MSLKRTAAAILLGVCTAATLGQMSIDAPAPTAPPAPATQPIAAEAPAPAPAAAPSAANVLEGLLKDKSDTANSGNTSVPMPTGGVDATANPALPNVAPAGTKTNRIREGEFIGNRTGRLGKDEKTGNWYFTFESDGKDMRDPPMQLIPSKFLMAMEAASAEGTQPMRFKVDGQVTEYQGKNFLWVQHMEILKDLNKGIGG